MTRKKPRTFHPVEILRRGWNAEHKLLARLYARKAIKGIRKAMAGLGQEAGETRKMAESFYKLLEHKLNLNERNEPPTREEVKEAIEQLKDVGRLSVFISAVIFPGGVFSLLGLEFLARKFGIRFSFIPSSFKKEKKTDQP
ncbi:MAG: hypothetical protein GXO83_10820 [Chlorobi bacterium]|nr:hypothetical protein [Chlorobiota bacterium]